MNYIGFYIYCVGMIIAFIVGCVQAYKADKNGEDIRDFPACISVISFMSWIYIIIVSYRYFYEKNKNKE